MSESAKIILCGHPRESLLAEIASIRKWDNGHNYPILVSANGNVFIDDSIDNVENAINNNLVKYIEDNFNSKNKMLLKSGHSDDLYLVPDYERYEDSKFHKIRRKPTNLTPKKKKRK
jgi:hypothetical protein